MKPVAQSDLDEILAATGQLWGELRGQRLFLTGGTGFFGTWLLESFAHTSRQLALNAQVIVLTRNPQAFAAKAPHLAAHPAITLLQGDVRTFDFPPGDFPFIIHAATEASAALVANRPAEMLSTVLEGTQRVLRFAAQANTRKLLLTSTGAVYGPQPPSVTHVAEDFPGGPDPLQPSSVYAEGKRLAELLCVLAATSSFEVKIARCFAFVGPHLPLDTHFAVGNFLADTLAHRPLTIAGDGTPLRSYLYATDLMIWLWTILFQAPSKRAYNVGSEHAFSIRELALAVAATRNPPLQVSVARPAITGQPPARYIPSTLRAQQELSLQQTVPFEEALRRTLNWHSTDPNFPVPTGS